jgi:glycerol uptake facilitator-like aquaporin
MASAVPLSKKFLAELFGTFWLVLGGCGIAVLAANFPYDNAAANPLGLGFLGVSLAFGLTLLTMVYAIGHISGCHINPAVSFGLWASGKFPGSNLLAYVVAQVLGAIIAGGVIVAVAVRAAAATATDPTSAGRGFAGKVDVLGEGQRERVTVGAHRVVGERSALPRLDAGRGRGAAGEEGGGRKAEGEKKAGAHGIKR